MSKPAPMIVHNVFFTLHPRHVKFVDENKPHWKKVRVFDSAVGP